MLYEYDLLSGNVNEVVFQKGKTEQFYHRYYYDADNRIIDVETSRDGYLWDRDAHYAYYPHGPLAREEIGQQQVQGRDYAYTIHGWLKSVNASVTGIGYSLGTYDIGEDGLQGGMNRNRDFGTDAFNYSLQYFSGDYSSAYSGANFLADINWNASISNNVGAYYRNLYNGNIGGMITSIADPVSLNTDYDDAAPARLSVYQYDQLNRLREGYSVESNTLTMINMLFDFIYDAYRTTYRYDGNGNITFLSRTDGEEQSVDILSYLYDKGFTGQPERNRLLNIWDDISADYGYDDIKSQGSGSITDYSQNNYGYDASGNLIRDNQEEIAEILWTPTGKVQEIIRQGSSSKPSLAFEYNSMGQRVKKEIDEVLSTYYVRDAQGNVLAVYEREFLGGSNYALQLREQTIYGSSRLGMQKRDESIDGTMQSTSSSLVLPEGQKREFQSTSNITVANTGGFGNMVNIWAGSRPVHLSGGSFNVVSGSGGVGLTSFTLPAWSSVTVTWLPAYAFVMSSESSIFVEAGKELTMITPSGTLYYKDESPAYYMQQLGHKQYELTNHLGNVQAVVSDRKDRITDDVDPKKLGFFVADMVSYTDYYPFGWSMPGRRYNQGEYRYGAANGQEKVDEIKGEGNHYTAEFWEYDPRAVHRWNPDPVIKPHESPYAILAGNPIWFMDPLGADTIDVNKNDDGKWEVSNTQIIEGDDVFRIHTPGSETPEIHTFSEGEYGNRMNYLRLESGENETFGVYHLSGTNTTGYVLEPEGPSTFASGTNKRIPAGGYNLDYGAGGENWPGYPLVHNSDLSAGRGVKIHYGTSRKWSAACLVISSDYVIDKTSNQALFNLGQSQEASWELNQYFGASSRDVDFKNTRGKNRHKLFYDDPSRLRSSKLNIK